MRHLTPLKTHSERMKKTDKNMVNDHDYEGIEFPFSKKKNYCKIELKCNICINVYHGMVYHV